MVLETQSTGIYCPFVYNFPFLSRALRIAAGSKEQGFPYGGAVGRDRQASRDSFAHSIAAQDPVSWLTIIDVRYFPSISYNFFHFSALQVFTNFGLFNRMLTTYDAASQVFLVWLLGRLRNCLNLGRLGASSGPVHNLLTD